MPTDATQPVQVSMQDLQNFGNEYQDGANTFGKQVASTPGNTALIYNPFTRAFIQNPNFLTPTEAQTLQNERLAYMSQVDPATAKELAQVHNTSTNATQVPGSELGNYRLPDGSQPRVGATYGQLVTGGAANLPQGTNAALTSLRAEAALIQQAHTAFIQANSNQGSGAIHGLLAKIGIGPGATYDNLLKQLGSAGVGLPQLGSDPSAVNSAFTSKLNQLAQQFTAMEGQANQTQQQPQQQQQPQPQPQQPPTNYGAIDMSQPAAGDPYSNTAAPNINPAQMGANAYALGQAGIGNQ